MTGGASTSIQISYSTEDGGIATEEIIGFSSDFSAEAEVEEVEEYPMSCDSEENNICGNDGVRPKFINTSIGFELKMLTLITDKNSDGVRIIRPEEQELMKPCDTNKQSCDTESIKSATNELPEISKVASIDSPVVIPYTNTTDIPFVNDTIEITKVDTCAVRKMSAIDVLWELFGDCSDDSLDDVPQEENSLELQSSQRDISFEFPSTSYDGPPTLSPNYAHESGQIDKITEVGILVSPCHTIDEESPPDLIMESSPMSKEGCSKNRHYWMKRNSKSRNSKSKSGKLSKKIIQQWNEAGKSIVKAQKEALHIVIPHSSAEIQERVKNRQRKSTVAFGSSSIGEIKNEAVIESKVLPKVTKPKKRKLSTSESNPSSDPKKVKVPTSLYIVEKILKKGIINGSPYFFVKWLNYPNSKNTWEPEENFSLDLIAAYEKNLEETGQAPVIEQVNLKKVNLKKIQFKPQPIVRQNSKINKEKCPGCLSYPVTFTDNRTGPNGFSEGLTYHKIYESFVLDEERCALVEFDEKVCLELLPLKIINERLKAEIKLH